MVALVFVALPAGSALASTRAKDVTSGFVHTCALAGSGGVKCWGARFGWMPVDVRGLESGVKAISAGWQHTCALTDAGAVKCWGDNTYGQLGDGTTTDDVSLVPVDVKGLGSGVKAISGGGYHTCAVTDSGEAKCWGQNNLGQLGDGTTGDSSVPVDVKGLESGVKAISPGINHTCALTDSGAVKCWGNNGAGQLGDGTTTISPVPVDVKGLGSAVAGLRTGGEHACAVTDSGAVKCWGRNNLGQLGDGTTKDSSVPVDVTGLGSRVAAISAGDFHVCAMTDSGAVKCWGDNFAGQLGDGTTTDSSVPVDVKGLGSGVASMGLGGAHTCAVTDSGAVKCWGLNSWGQLGDNSTRNSLVPVDVMGLGADDAQPRLRSGGPGNDRISGDSGDDRISGGRGDDRISGGGGNDTLSGGRGNDLIFGGRGNDVISGGSGNDRIHARDGHRDLVDCGPGRDVAFVDPIDLERGCERVVRRG